MLVSGGELFHRTDLARPTRRRLGRVIDSFLELREGDYVVHLAHGIARYRGMQLLEKEDQVEEHLELEFHGGTKIYVPAVEDRAGAEVRRRQRRAGRMLARIGGTAWVRQKERAQQAVLDLAGEMLELQAARAAQPGIAFPPDTEWQQEFDAAFPYHETPDQLTAIDAIKRDMRQPRPMDRLICGDVGYGKTEAGHAGGVQGGRRRLPGGRARADDGAGRAALPHVHRADGRVSRSRSPRSAASARKAAAEAHPGAAAAGGRSTSSSARTASCSPT